MTETTAATTLTTQINRVYIKAPVQTVWDAITRPDWNRKYGYQCPSEYDLRPGGAYRVLANEAMTEQGASTVIIDGEVLVCEPPHKLVQTWRALFTPETEAEGFTRLTWELVEEQPGLTKLTVTHDVEGAPLVRAQVSGEMENAGGGWAFILSDLKTLLETGKPFMG
jgi:uncharacterized protein YndB with AHSA1/START domain